MINLKYPNFWSKKGWLSSIMVPFSYIYTFLGFIRTQTTKKIILPQKIICVGNIILGGSGKTQIVAWLAQKLTQKKISFVIVTKAYKSDLMKAKLVEKTDTAKEVGDESVMLRQYGPVIAAKKINYALPLIHRINPEIVILDDGMQNPVLQKNLQILAIDSLKGIGNNRNFPAGPLREGLKSGLAKSDLIFIIGNNQSRDFNLINSITLSQKPYFTPTIKLKENLDKNMEYIAFAGIGNPEKFYSLLLENNLKVKQYISFGDHHHYSEDEIKKLLELARLNKASLITTEKDYVKLTNNYKELIICARVGLEFENEQKSIDLIYEKLFQEN
jgi:tetraacyldisaccharide 4'-kinase